MIAKRIVLDLITPDVHATGAQDSVSLLTKRTATEQKKYRLVFYTLPRYGMSSLCPRGGMDRKEVTTKKEWRAPIGRRSRQSAAAIGC